MEKNNTEKLLYTIRRALIGGLIVLLVILFVLIMLDLWNDIKTQKAEAEAIELIRQDIASEYGFDVVLWLDVEKVENLDGRSDFLIVTCLVDDGELREYRFACEIASAVDGEIDVDTWRIKEGE